MPTSIRVVVFRPLCLRLPSKAPPAKTRHVSAHFSTASVVTRCGRRRYLPCRKSSSSPTTTTSTSPSPSPSPSPTPPPSSSVLSDSRRRAPNAVLPERLVTNPTLQRLQPYLGHLAYLSIASGFLMTDIFPLRLTLVCGYSGLVAYHAVQLRPMRIPLFWSAVFMAVNAYHASRIASDLYPGEFSDDEEDLYRSSFSQLTRGQFARLMDRGTVVTFPPGAKLTEEGVPCDRLYFVLDGRADLYLDGRVASVVRSGGFVNSLAVQQGAYRAEMDGMIPSYGTTRCSEQTRTVAWDMSDLRALLKTSADLELRLNHVLTAALMRRLLRSRDGETRVDDRIGRRFSTAHDDAHGLPGGGDEISAAEWIARTRLVRMVTEMDRAPTRKVAKVAARRRTGVDGHEAASLALGPSGSHPITKAHGKDDVAAPTPSSPTPSSSTNSFGARLTRRTRRSNDSGVHVIAVEKKGQEQDAKTIPTSGASSLVESVPPTLLGNANVNVLTDKDAAGTTRPSDASVP